MIRAAVLLLALTLPAATDGPGPDFQPEDQPADVSPDGQVEVRQYFKPGNDYVFQFWTFDRDHQHAHLLNPGETGTMTQYAAGFRFSPDSQWLVRMQKVAAGESTLFLYRRDGVTYAPATPKPLGDLAWDYLFSQPEGQAVAHAELSRETVLVRGMDDDYRSLGQHCRRAASSSSRSSAGRAQPRPWGRGAASTIRRPPPSPSRPISPRSTTARCPGSERAAIRCPR
ncbi:MAG: hypothetical protein WDO13_13235, partial [Verrucomicrobiota bacterium]